MGNGKFLWIYEHPTRSTHNVVKGSFANQNHFRSFPGVGHRADSSGVCRIGIATDRRQTNQFSATTVPPRSSSVIHVNVPGCRLGTGGVCQFVVVFARWLARYLSGRVLVCVGIYAAKGFVNRRTIVVAVRPLACDFDCRIHSWSPTGAVSSEHHHGRFARRDRCATRASQDLGGRGQGDPTLRRFMGAGVGSHRDVYPTFMKEWSKTLSIRMPRAVTCKCLLETGVPGTAVADRVHWPERLLAGLTTLRHSSSRRISAIAGALAAGWAATVVHSGVDFVWYIPACASVTILLLAATLVGCIGSPLQARFRSDPATVPGRVGSYA